MQIPGVDHRKSLLAQLPAHGLVATVDDKLRCAELELDDAQYCYLLSLLNLPSRPMVGMAADDRGTTHDDLRTPDIQASTTVKKAPEYNRDHKLEQIQVVKACLPEEDETLIEACLASMEWSSERVVDAILQDKLPGHLRATAGGSLIAPGNQLVYAPGIIFHPPCSVCCAPDLL